MTMNMSASAPTFTREETIMMTKMLLDHVRVHGPDLWGLHTIENAQSKALCALLDALLHYVLTSFPIPVIETIQTLSGPLLRINGVNIMQQGDTVADTLAHLRKAFGLEVGA